MQIRQRNHRATLVLQMLHVELEGRRLRVNPCMIQIWHTVEGENTDPATLRLGYRPLEVVHRILRSRSASGWNQQWIMPLRVVRRSPTALPIIRVFRIGPPACEGETMST